MKRIFLLLSVGLSLLLAGCAPTTAPAPHGPVSVSCTGQLKRVTQLDLKDNHPLKSWNACSETIHQHVSPPVGITFIDEETGQQVHFAGTYKIETYKPAPTP